MHVFRATHSPRQHGDQAGGFAGELLIPGQFATAWVGRDSRRQHNLAVVAEYPGDVDALAGEILATLVQLGQSGPIDLMQKSRLLARQTVRDAERFTLGTVVVPIRIGESYEIREGGEAEQADELEQAAGDQLHMF